MNPIRSSPRRILLPTLYQPLGITRGPLWFSGRRPQFSPLSHLVRVPMNPTGPPPPSPTRTPARQEVSVMGFVPLPTSRGSFMSVVLPRPPPQAKGTQRQRTITFPNRRSLTRTLTTSPRTLILLPARDHLSNQTHRRPCTIPKTITIRPSPPSSRIRRYPRYQVLLRVSPLPSSSLAAINF